jgi:E3 ubiquitin-protein ligase NRDP1
MNKGTLSFSLNGENMGIAYTDEVLKTGTYYPAVALLHCAGCRIRGGLPVPSYFY